MKRILLLFIALTSFGVARAQFPVNAINYGFESWTTSNGQSVPDNWKAANLVYKLTSLKFYQPSSSGGTDTFIVTAHEQTTFAGLRTGTANNLAYPALLVTSYDFPQDTLQYFNATVGYFPVAQGEQAELEAVWYKKHTATDTSDHVKHDTVATSTILVGGAKPWTTISAPIKYRMHGVYADSIFIGIISSIGNSNGQYGIGTMLIVDELKFSNDNTNAVDTSKTTKVRKAGLNEIATNVVGVSAYPNPFSLNTTINYVMPTSGIVNLGVYDIQGRLVQTLVNGQQPAGIHTTTFDGAGLNEGVYMYRLQTAGQVQTGKLILSK
jgi:hypothetical protein